MKTNPPTPPLFTATDLHVAQPSNSKATNPHAKAQKTRWTRTTSRAEGGSDSPIVISDSAPIVLRCVAACRHGGHSQTLSSVAAENKCVAAKWLVSKGCKPKAADNMANTPMSTCDGRVYRGYRSTDRYGVEQEKYTPGPIYGMMQAALLEARAELQRV